MTKWNSAAFQDSRDEEWVFVCDDCSEQWPLTQKAGVNAHEQAHGHSVYERYRGRGNDDRRSSE